MKFYVGQIPSSAIAHYTHRVVVYIVYSSVSQTFGAPVLAKKINSPGGCGSSGVKTTIWESPLDSLPWSDLTLHTFFNQKQSSLR